MWRKEQTDKLKLSLEKWCDIKEMCFQSNLLDTTTTTKAHTTNPFLPQPSRLWWWWSPDSKPWVHQQSAEFKSNLPLKKIYKSKILLSIKQLHGPPLVGLRDCITYIFLAICTVDDAIIPFWKEEVLNQKCKQNCSTRFFTISWWNDVHDHVHASSEMILILSVNVAVILPVIIPWFSRFFPISWRNYMSMNRSVLQVNPFWPFLQSCRSVCNHPVTQTSGIKRIKKDWEVERLHEMHFACDLCKWRCNHPFLRGGGSESKGPKHSTWSSRFFAISWWNEVHDHVSASSERISILSAKVQ